MPRLNAQIAEDAPAADLATMFRARGGASASLHTLRPDPARHAPGAGFRMSARGIDEAGAFRTVLERERSRHDRNHHGFTLAVFERSMDASRRTREKFVELVATRARFTDDVGWLGPREIGVLLPETSVLGAQRFADKVRVAAQALGMVVPCRIFTYPDELGREDGDSQPWFENSSAQPAHEHRAVATHGGVDDAAPVALLADAGQAATVDPDASIQQWAIDPPPAWKRLFDFTAALAALVVLAPLMALIALAVKCVSPGPAFFKQERIGRSGKLFLCWKFRTMHLNGSPSSHANYMASLIHSDAPMTKLDDRKDPRLIPMAKVLRKCGLDELPQLINVLRGEMSLIGPRPCLPYEYKEYARWHRQRADAMPGLTGLWQVSGKNRTTFTEMIRLDIAYRRKLSIWLDLRILFRTIPAILSQLKEGAASRRANRLTHLRT